MNMDIAAIVEEFFASLKAFFEQIKALFDSLFGGSTPDDENDGE